MCVKKSSPFSIPLRSSAWERPKSRGKEASLPVRHVGLNCHPPAPVCFLSSPVYEFYVQARSRNLITELKDTLQRLFALNSRLHVAIMEQQGEAELRIKAESSAVEKQRFFTMMVSHEIR